jgi:hypothetical protein
MEEARDHMKKGFLALTLVLFAGLMFLSVGVLTAGTPDRSRLKTSKDDKKASSIYHKSTSDTRSPAPNATMSTRTGRMSGTTRCLQKNVANAMMQTKSRGTRTS